MEEKILNEITDFCNECSRKDYCDEKECVLYRIENIVTDKTQVFKIEVKETLSKIITVKALNAEDALEKAEDRYRNSEIILDGNDCVSYEIEVLESDANEK